MRSKTVKTIRPLPESLITVFGQKLEKQGWGDLAKENNPGKMVEIFENTLAELVSSTFPEKIIHIYPDDKPWFTEKLRQLKRQRQRLYSKGGRSQKYLACQKQFDELSKIEISKYREKIITEVKDGKRGSAYAGLRKLGRRPGEFEQSGFQLQN